MNRFSADLNTLDMDLPQMARELLDSSANLTGMFVTLLVATYGVGLVALAPVVVGFRLASRFFRASSFRDPRDKSAIADGRKSVHDAVWEDSTV